VKTTLAYLQHLAKRHLSLVSFKFKRIRRIS
jgi:hypothetical protein